MKHEAVFISDLHLNPNEPLITQRFVSFIQWAAQQATHVYILGDFFHVWPGDDALDEWSISIANHLASLARIGVRVFIMPGNRDFLLGKHFANLAKITLLNEPSLITLGGQSVLLVHGDRYCTNDTAHQWLRRITRNRLFYTLFKYLPRSFRFKLVARVREHSQFNQTKSVESMAIVKEVMFLHMQQFNVSTIIHGHIHKAGLTIHKGNGYQQFVLSDWDSTPSILCYNKANGLYFNCLEEHNYVCS